MDSLRKSVCRGLLEQTLQPIFLRTISAKDHLTLTGIVDLLRGGLAVMNCTKSRRTVPKNGKCTNKWTYWEGEENFVGDSEIIALGGASNETKDRPLG